MTSLDSSPSLPLLVSDAAPPSDASLVRETSSATEADKSKTALITESPLFSATLRFGLPLALGMAFQTAFNLIDAWLVSLLPKEEAATAIGAVGICDQLTAVGTIVSYGVSTATATKLAQAAGRKDKDAIGRIAFQSMILVTLLSLVFSLIGIFFSEPVLRGGIGAKGNVADLAARAMQVLLGGGFTIFYLLHFASIQRALGSAKTPVLLLALGSILNLVFAVIFVFGDTATSVHPEFFVWGRVVARALHIPKMGLMGAAWATVLSRLLVLIPNAIVLLKRFPDVLPKKAYRVFEKKHMMALLDLSWPSSAQLVVRMLSMLLVHSLVARAFTTESDQTASTGMGLVFRPDTMALFLSMGWGSGGQTFVGQNLGAKKPTRAFHSGLLFALWNGICMLGLAFALLKLGPMLLGVFCREAGPLAFGLNYLSIVTFAYLPMGISIVLANSLSGAEANKLILKIDSLHMLFVQAPLCIFATLYFKTPSKLFQAFGASMALLGVIYLITFFLFNWKKASETH